MVVVDVEVALRNSVVVDVEVVLRNFGVIVMPEVKVSVLVSLDAKVPLMAKLVPASAETVTKTVTVRVPSPASGVLVAMSEVATLRCELTALRMDAMSVTEEVEVLVAISEVAPPRIEVASLKTVAMGKTVGMSWPRLLRVTVVQVQTVTVLLCSAAILERSEDATLTTEDSGGIEKGKLVSIVLLGNKGLELSETGTLYESGRVDVTVLR